MRLRRSDLARRGAWGVCWLLTTVVLAESAADLCRAGAALYAKGDLPGAAARFRQALAQEPRNDSAHVGLGVVLTPSRSRRTPSCTSARPSA